MKVIVDISDARVSNDPADVLVTYSLGSCIGVALYDPVVKAGGMIHYQLPSSKQDSNGGQKNPMMFADTGMELLMNRMFALGAEKKRMKVRVAGGAQMMNDAQIFNIGKRNYAALRQILWKNGMFIDAEDVGGGAARTLYLNIENGEVSIKTQGETKEL